MSNSLIFGDSFGHYNNILSKWDTAGDNQIVLNNASLARTNAGCLQIVSGSDGPSKTLATTYNHLIAGVAFNLDTAGPGEQTSIFEFRVLGFGYNIAVRVNVDSTFSAWRGNPGDGGSVELIRTLFRPMVWNTWNYVTCEVVISDSNGSVVLNVNGRVVGSISGVRTSGVFGSPVCNEFKLFGAESNGALSYLADFQLIDASQSPGTVIPQCKVYVTTPNANGSPTDWTPLSGQNFSNVNEIPPDDDTSYNSSATVGQVDQYQHSLAAIPVGASIAANQHCLDMKVDSGARTVASDLAGSVGTGSALTTSYVQYCTQRDTDPSPSPVSAGPKVTA